jgi:hypothetical protein
VTYEATTRLCRDAQTDDLKRCLDPRYSLSHSRTAFDLYLHGCQGSDEYMLLQYLGFSFSQLTIRGLGNEFPITPAYAI